MARGPQAIFRSHHFVGLFSSSSVLCGGTDAYLAKIRALVRSAVSVGGMGVSTALTVDDTRPAVTLLPPSLHRHNGLCPCSVSQCEPTLLSHFSQYFLTAVGNRTEQS